MALARDTSPVESPPNGAPADVAHREVSQQEISLHFPRGMVGCPQWTQFILRVDPDNEPIVELHSLDEPEVIFLAMEPHHAISGYAFELPPAFRDDLALGPDDEPLTLVIMVVRHESSEVTVNLAGPLVINLQEGKARQIVLDGDRYPVRHPIGI